MKLDTRIVRLKNGLCVATTRVPNAESVALGISIGVGSRHEASRLNGISHFLEHLLFKGTTTRTARQISEAIEGRGGYLNACTQEESTFYYARIASEHTAEAFEVLADMYLHPRFDPDDIEKERGVILEEIAMYNDQPGHVAAEQLDKLLWPNHPLGRPLAGTEHVVRRISRADIVAFKRRRYIPANTFVLFAGDIKHDAAVRAAKAMMDSLRGPRPLPARPVTSDIKPRAFAAAKKDVEQTHIAAGIRVFGRRNPRRFALKLLSVILGENMSSRLFQIVREKHGLAYSIQSAVSLFADTGVMEISAGVDVPSTAKAWTLIVSELARLARSKVSSRELQQARDYTIGQLRLSLENAGNQLLWVGEHLLGFGRVIQPEEYIRAFSAVTADDILGVAQTFVRPKRMSVSMVSPLEVSEMQIAWQSGLRVLA